MFRHYSSTTTAQPQHLPQILGKCDTKFLLYGRRDKVSIQKNRHLGHSSECQKCPKYVHQVEHVEDANIGHKMRPEFTLDIANNNSNNSKSVDQHCAKS